MRMADARKLVDGDRIYYRKSIGTVTTTPSAGRFRVNFESLELETTLTLKNARAICLAYPKISEGVPADEK